MYFNTDCFQDHMYRAKIGSGGFHVHMNALKDMRKYCRINTISWNTTSCSILPMFVRSVFWLWILSVVYRVSRQQNLQQQDLQQQDLLQLICLDVNSCVACKTCQESPDPLPCMTVCAGGGLWEIQKQTLDISELQCSFQWLPTLWLNNN